MQSPNLAPKTIPMSYVIGTYVKQWSQELVLSC